MRREQMKWMHPVCNGMIDKHSTSYGQPLQATPAVALAALRAGSIQDDGIVLALTAVRKLLSPDGARVAGELRGAAAAAFGVLLAGAIAAGVSLDPRSFGTSENLGSSDAAIAGMSPADSSHVSMQGTGVPAGEQGRLAAAAAAVAALRGVTGAAGALPGAGAARRAAPTVGVPLMFSECVHTTAGLAARPPVAAHAPWLLVPRVHQSMLDSTIRKP